MYGHMRLAQALLDLAFEDLLSKHPDKFKGAHKFFTKKTGDAAVWREFWISASGYKPEVIAVRVEQLLAQRAERGMTNADSPDGLNPEHHVPAEMHEGGGAADPQPAVPEADAGGVGAEAEPEAAADDLGRDGPAGEGTMNIFFCGRHEAERVTLDRPWAIISITDPESDPARVGGLNCQGILRLSFWDLSTRVDAIKDGYFHQRDVQKILDFYEWAKQHAVETLLVHCEAGISRSCAVAAALAYLDGQDTEWYFKKGIPNMALYGSILERADRVARGKAPAHQPAAEEALP